MTSKPVITQTQILAETARALQRTRPRRMFGRFLLETAFYSTLLVGGGIWSAGGLAEYGIRPLAVGLGSSVFIALLSRFSEFRQLRKHLRTTDSEVAQQIRSEIRWLTGPWWPLRMGGLGAALGLTIGTFAGVLGAIVEPELTLAFSIGRSLAVAVPLIAVFFLLLRFPLVARIESLVSAEPASDLPNSA